MRTGSPSAQSTTTSAAKNGPRHPRSPWPRGRASPRRTAGRSVAAPSAGRRNPGPAGTAIAGRPAMFTVTVKMSFRYISTGSPLPFSPMPKADDGVAGVSIASMPAAKASSKSRLISVRTFCARKIIGVVIAGGEHIGADQHAPLHLAPEAGRARLLVHRDDVVGLDAQAVAHAVVAGEVGGRLGRRDDVVGGKRVFRMRQRDVDDLGARRAIPLDPLLPERPRSPPACRPCGIPSARRSSCPSRSCRPPPRSPAPRRRPTSCPSDRPRPSTSAGSPRRARRARSARPGRARRRRRRCRSASSGHRSA